MKFETKLNIGDPVIVCYDSFYHRGRITGITVRLWPKYEDTPLVHYECEATVKYPQKGTSEEVPVKRDTSLIESEALELLGRFKTQMKKLSNDMEPKKRESAALYAMFEEDE